jgi:hypothetical protein
LISDIVVDQQHELWSSLKACRNPLCSVILNDSSKNRSGCGTTPLSMISDPGVVTSVILQAVHATT